LRVKTKNNSALMECPSGGIWFKIRLGTLRSG